MPEETDTSTRSSETAADSGTQDTAGTESTTSGADGVQDETGTETGSQSDGDAQEAATDDSAGDEPFDRKRFEAELRKKNSEAANLRKRLKELEPLAAKAREYEDAQKSETERLTDQLARATEQVTAARQRLARKSVQALAARADGDRAAFADPEDALGALDLDSYIDDDGDIDESAIEADLQGLLARKPHWAAPTTASPQEGPRRPAPDRTQASAAKQTRTLTPQDEFQGWLKTRLR